MSDKCCYLSDGFEFMLVPAVSGYDRLAELDSMPVLGNAFNISLLAAADEIIRDESEPLEIRYAALQKLDEVMGLIPRTNEIPEHAIAEYLENTLA